MGMAAFLAAVTQAPLTAFIIVMEMVDGHSLVLSLMASAMIASMVSRMIARPLYESLALHMLNVARAAMAPPEPAAEPVRQPPTSDSSKESQIDSEVSDSWQSEPPASQEPPEPQHPRPAQGELEFEEKGGKDAGEAAPRS